MKKFFLAIVGVVCILIGLMGLILPIIPGLVFIFIGMSFIAPHFTERLKRRIFHRLLKNGVVPLKDWKKHLVYAGFTTRHCGLLLKNTDDLLIAENQEKFRKLLEPSFNRFVFMKQVHGTQVAILEDGREYAEGKFHQLLETDGVISNIHGLVLLAMTADCLSIFFYALPKNAKRATWVGVVHAGWRGTKGRIAETTFKLMQEKARCLSSEIHIAFGACIGKNQYEVGPEFKNFFPTASLHMKQGKLLFDLAGENRRQLLAAGADPRYIFDRDICTIEENDNFYSYRKEKEAAGRSVSFIAIT